MFDAMTMIMDGNASEAQIGAFLMGLSQRGETIEEITGAARSLRNRASTIVSPDNSFDCCGTGGDGAHTYNISTAVAFVAAGCNIPVAKHGNRASSSLCGAADVLEALDINLTSDSQLLQECLIDLNFCFLMAPHHHAAMKHLKDARKELGFKTLPNLLGPLANPANVKNQLIGVYDKKWLTPIAKVLHNLGADNVWVVCGRDGLDEITITEATDIAILKDGDIAELTVTASDFGLQTCSSGDLKGGDAKVNAAALLALLKGAPSAYRDIVIANTAALVKMNNDQLSLLEAAKLCAETIDSGRAFDVMDQYRERVKGTA